MAAAIPKKLVLFAYLRRLHAGLGFGLGFVGAIIHDRRRRSRGLSVNHGALFRRRIANDVELGGHSGLGGKDKRCKRGRNDIFVHNYLLRFPVTRMKHL